MDIEKEVQDRVKVYSCSRCDKDHSNVEVYGFEKHGIVIDDTEYSHWGICPETDDPILIFLDS